MRLELDDMPHRYRAQAELKMAKNKRPQRSNSP